MINVIPTIVLAALTGDAEGQTVLGGEERSLFSLGSLFGGGGGDSKPAKDITTTDEGPVKRAKCVFPFKSGFKTFHDCTPVNGKNADTYPGKAWCATATDIFGNYVAGSWGICPATACKDSRNGGAPNKVDCICNKATECSKGEYCRPGETRKKHMCSKTPECSTWQIHFQKCDCILNGENNITNENNSRVLQQTCNAQWQCNPNANKKIDICTQSACDKSSCKTDCLPVGGKPHRLACQVSVKKSPCTDQKIENPWSMDACGKTRGVSIQKCSKYSRDCKCKRKNGKKVGSSNGWFLTKKETFSTYVKITCERHVQCNDYTYHSLCAILPATLDQRKQKSNK